jgi:hypothetical protein
MEEDEEEKEVAPAIPKRKVNPSAKGINIILKSKGPLKLRQVREAMLDKDPDAEEVMNDTRFQVDWDMTLFCKDCQNLAACRAVIKDKGANGCTYIPVKLRGDSMRLTKEKVFTSTLD